MRRSVRIFLASIVLLLLANLVRAGNLDVEIHSVPKRADQDVKQGSGGGAAVTKEHWVYDVTIENKTFKELTNLEVKYLIFFKQEQLGAKAGRPHGVRVAVSASPRSSRTRRNHSVPIPLSSTNPISLASGFIPLAQNRMRTTRSADCGFAFTQDGAQFSEFADPSTLTKEKWQ